MTKATEYFFNQFFTGKIGIQLHGNHTHLLLKIPFLPKKIEKFHKRSNESKLHCTLLQNYTEEWNHNFVILKIMSLCLEIKSINQQQSLQIYHIEFHTSRMQRKP